MTFIESSYINHRKIRGEKIKRAKTERKKRIRFGTNSKSKFPNPISLWISDNHKKRIIALCKERPKDFDSASSLIRKGIENLLKDYEI